MKTVDPNLLSKTKKVRRVQLANVPLHLGLTKEEVKTLATQFIIDMYLNDPGNQNPIHTLELTPQKNTVILELSSVEESNRIQKIDSIKILGVTCKVIRCTETIYGPEASMVAKVQNAQVNSTERSQGLRRCDDRRQQTADSGRRPSVHEPAQTGPEL